jgi:hypothetical protein
MATKKTEQESQDALQPQGSMEPDAAPTTVEEVLAGAPYRLLVNPSGNTIAFPLRDPKLGAEFVDPYERHLNSQRPVHVKKASEWFREPTVEEALAYVKAHPFKK